MAKITIICDVDTYRLSLNGVEGDESEYGDPAFLTTGAKSYMALVCEDDQGNRFSLLDGDDWVVEVRKSVDYEFEGEEDAGVDSGDSEDDSDDDGDGDGDDDDDTELEEDNDEPDDSDLGD